MKKYVYGIVFLSFFINSKAMQPTQQVMVQNVSPAVSSRIEYNKNVLQLIEYVGKILKDHSLIIDPNPSVMFTSYKGRIRDNGGIALGFVKAESCEVWWDLVPRYIFTPKGRFDLFDGVSYFYEFSDFCKFASPQEVSYKFRLTSIFRDLELKKLVDFFDYGNGTHGPVYSILRDTSCKELPTAEFEEISNLYFL